MSTQDSGDLWRESAPTGQVVASPASGAALPRRVPSAVPPQPDGPTVAAPTLPQPRDPIAVRAPVDPRPVDPTTPGGGRRLLGLPLPAWIIAGALGICLVIGAVVILPRLPVTAAPPDSALGGDTDPGSGIVVAGVPGTTAASPGASASATPQPSGQTPPPAVPPLVVTRLVTTRDVLGLLGWKVSITLHNPASVEQSWTNVSVYAKGGRVDTLLTPSSEGLTLYTSGDLVCAEPKDPTTALAPANGDATIELHVATSRAPGPAVVDDPNCHRPADA
jgi:hypothetical protein